MGQKYIGRIGVEEVRVVEERGKKRVMINGRQYMSWEKWDEGSQRMAIVQLHRMGIANQEELSEKFEAHKNSVQRYIRDYDHRGLEGVVTRKSGPKARWKISGRVRSKILLIAIKEGLLEPEGIRQRLAQWNERIGVTSIREVLMENGLIREDSGVATGREEQKELFDRTREGQLALDFSCDKSPENGEGQSAKVEEEEIIDDEEVLEVREGKYRRSYSQSQRAYLDQLEQGYYNAYAGGLLYAPLIRRCSFTSTIEDVMKMGAMEGYNLEELSLTLMYLDVFRYRTMEDFKRAYAEEFGVLIGRTNSPSHYSLRRFLGKIKELGRGEELMERFARMYLKRGMARWGVIYIDGHFLPYYGRYEVKKGYHGVRQIAMKGSYHFIGVDERFRPWIFLLRSSSEDLLKKIPEIIGKAKKIGREIGLKKEDLEKLIVLFDREGYSAELYRYFEGKDKNANKKRRVIFISWAKHVDRWMKEMLSEKFQGRMEVIYDVQEKKEVRYCETYRNMNKYGKIRAIVIEDSKDKKRSVIYTNAREDEMKPEEIIRLICRRWGEENLIKALMEKHQINYSPGYAIEQSPEQPMVKNPSVKKLKKEKVNKVSELGKLKVQLADKIIREGNEEIDIAAMKKEQVQLFADIAKIEAEMLFIKQEIDSLPTEVRFNEAYGKRLLKFNYEKKRFFDCIKVCSYNVERKMCEILLKHYGSKKEVVSALSMIVERGGYIKLENGRLMVRLRRFMNREINYAARHLCEDLNKMRPVTLDRFRFPLHYEVL
jgi:hypothetical protein